MFGFFHTVLLPSKANFLHPLLCSLCPLPPTNLHLLAREIGMSNTSIWRCTCLSGGLSASAESQARAEGTRANTQLYFSFKSSRFGFQIQVRNWSNWTFQFNLPSWISAQLAIRVGELREDSCMTAAIST